MIFKIVILRERDRAHQREDARPKDLLLEGTRFAKQVLRLPSLATLVRAALRMTIGVEGAA